MAGFSLSEPLDFTPLHRPQATMAAQANVRGVGSGDRGFTWVCSHTSDRKRAVSFPPHVSWDTAEAAAVVIIKRDDLIKLKPPGSDRVARCTRTITSSRNTL